MQTLSPLTFGIVALLSFGVAVLALWLLSLHPRRARSGAFNGAQGTYFLFDGHDLADATPSARDILDAGPKGTTDWDRFLAAFLPRFPDLKTKLAGLHGEGTLVFPARDPLDGTRLEAEWWNGLVNISLQAPDSSEGGAAIDPVSLSALRDELRILRRTAELAPFLVWQESESGIIVWANHAYLSLADRLYPSPDAPRSWPPRALFPPVLAVADNSDTRARRLPIDIGQGDDKKLWFDSYSRRVDGDVLHFAVEADNVVRAETSLRNFIQTLTMTFAHLPTGLAIFDRKRQLTLFNPALTDLLTLPIDFLSSRPTLHAFLDLLREKRMIPEPKDYKSWCNQMDDLENKARNGTYEEIWNLPSGQTYRIVGRPHPDGAVAFLFEDISAEVSLTRRFRSQLEVGQAVVDSFDEAIAVFSATGLLTFSNAAYVDLWGVDPSTTFGEMGITDAAQHWQEKAGQCALWDRAQRFVGQFGERAAFTEDVLLPDGCSLHCRFVPLPGGSTLAGFCHADPGAGQIDAPALEAAEI